MIVNEGLTDDRWLSENTVGAEPTKSVFAKVPIADYAERCGIPEDQIILMAYDDIANAKENPFPGKIFNKSTKKGHPGVDVYEGCKIDYKGKQVTK